MIAEYVYRTASADAQESSIQSYEVCASHFNLVIPRFHEMKYLYDMLNGYRNASELVSAFR